MSEKVDFHMFKEGIKPVWEDNANCKGGKWILRLKKGLSSRIWENLLLAMIGNFYNNNCKKIYKILIFLIWEFSLKIDKKLKNSQK